MADAFDGNFAKWPVRHSTVDPATLAFSVTPDDGKDLPSSSAMPSYASSFFVGGAGDVRVTALQDKTGSLATSVLLKNIQNGQHVPLAVRRIWSTNTTASAIAAFTD